MKKQIPSFAAGVLTMALVSSLGIGALAVSAAMTITVDPINVQVNGQVFQPKDVNGQDVPVFVYNGTTYAPLRALAEAYGLEVGYDAGTNMATVTGDVATPGDTTPPAPDTTASVNDYSDWTAEEEAAYQEFKGMWEVDKTATLKNTMNRDALCQWFSDRSPQIEKIAIRFAEEFGTYSEQGDLWMYFHSGEDGARYSAVASISSFDLKKFTILD